MAKDFDAWNAEKKEINKRESLRTFHEREVWFIKIGTNIGFEQDGGSSHMRPVLVYKKFSKRIFLGIPLTKTKRDGVFYKSFTLKGKESTAILSQLRLFDAKRLQYKVAKLMPKTFEEIKQKLIALLQ